MSTSANVVDRACHSTERRHLGAESGDNGNGFRHRIRILNGPNELALEELFEEAAARGLASVGVAAESGDENDPEAVIEPLGLESFFVTRNEEMKRLRERATLIAQKNVPVLLLGESGTGKEILALLIHQHSPRRARPFLKVNCAALPASLLESEFFGFEAGAFTGAQRSKPGLFEQCDGGTILLDEIGEMPAPLQAKLLQVLQDGTFSRLGGKSTVRTDVRVLAATNLEISRALAEGRLREDLYYRLTGFVLSLPPLRKRRADVPLLLRHFIARHAQSYGLPARPLSSDLLERAVLYPWPGNVRELENFARRYVILGDDKLVLQELMPSEERPISGAQGRTKAFTMGGRDLKAIVRATKQEVETDMIAHALGQTNGSLKEAAKLLHISYKGLLNKVHEYGIDPRQPAKPRAEKAGPAAMDPDFVALDSP